MIAPLTIERIEKGSGRKRPRKKGEESERGRRVLE